MTMSNRQRGQPAQTALIENADGYVLIAVYLFVCVRACLRVIRITQKVLNRMVG